MSFSVVRFADLIVFGVSKPYARAVGYFQPVRLADRYELLLQQASQRHGWSFLEDDWAVDPQSIPYH